MMAHNPAEINKKLANVMGWKLLSNAHNWYYRDMVEGGPHYVVGMDGSWPIFGVKVSDWNPYELFTYAFEVVKKITLPEDEGGLGYYCRMEVLPLADKEARYKCTFTKSDGMLGEGPGNSWKAYAATLSAAISLAVLEAKGERG